MMLSALSTLAAPAEHEISSLPGWGGPLPSRMYSGYIDVGAAAKQPMPMHVHYVFIEKEEQLDAGADPTILWTNGGPGASSMFGLLAELGPLLLNENSLSTPDFKRSGVPTLFSNPHAWTRLGSVVIFDCPPPVGFSYCADPSGAGTSCGDWDDERMAAVQYAALKGWFDLFPERRSKPLFLTGESYAGIYVPKLAQQILDHRDPDVYPQLRGFAVGDGCLGTESGICGGDKPWWNLLFLYGHGQISTLLWESILRECGEQHLKFGTGESPAGCSAALARVGGEAGGYFAYGLYDDCIYQEGLRRSRRRLGVRSDGSVGGLAARLGLGAKEVGGALNDYACGGGDAQSVWTNQSSVRAALHVPLNSFFFNGDNGAGMVYRSTEPNLMPFYRRVAKESELRVLIYNGDTDPSINSFAAQNWTSHLGFTPTQPWRAWTIDGCRRMGGYVTRYAERLDYLTIRGAGHMVPEFKPEAAYAFLEAWLAGDEYKPYVKSCKHPPPNPRRSSTVAL